MRFFFLFLSLVAVLCSQEVTGTIAGVAVDAAGAAVPGAIIIISNTSRNQQAAKVTTGDDGQYVATLLPIGTYSVTAEAKGFKKLTQKDIELHVSDRLSIRLELQI